ncbi:MAG: hypothetical protein JWL63_3081 [Rhodocyclales bacterium]|nr:hypothetical protein [Rhodocyclales bacterium]
MKFRKLLVAVVAVFVLLLGGLLVWLMQLDVKDIAALIERQATQTTGRALHIGGPISLQWSLIPTVAIEDVRLQNAVWGSQPDMLSVKRAEVQLALMPLFSGDIRIRKIVLDTPQVLLEVNAKGEQNWVFNSSSAPDTKSSHKLSINIAELRMTHGIVDYRPAAPARAIRLQIDALALQTAKADTAQLDGKFVFNEMPLTLSGTLPSIARLAEGVSSAPVDIKLDSLGVVVTVAGSVAVNQPALEGTELKFGVRADDPAASARLLKIELPHLPRTELAGRLLLGKTGLQLADVQVTSGKSSMRADLRMPLGASRLAVDVKLDAALIDLAELLGPAPKESAGGSAKVAAGKNERIFSDAPLPLEGLGVADAKGDIKLVKLVLRDGRTVRDVAAHFSLDKGHLLLDPLTLSVDGKTLGIRVQADANGGKSLGLNASVNATAVPLASLAALAGVSASPQAAPTDLAIKIAARGASVRQLMAGMDGDVRVVVGPGRWKGSAFDLGPALTTVLDVISPSGNSGEFTELKCAVLRFPVSHGVARLDTGIGVETSRIKLSANGTVNLGDETLNLGVHPKAVTGSNISVGKFAQLVRVSGTLTAPATSLDAVSAATTALEVGLALSKNGKGLSKGLLADTAPDNPCQVALGQAPVKAGAPQKNQAASDTVKNVGDTLEAVRGLFGK